MVISSYTCEAMAKLWNAAKEDRYDNFQEMFMSILENGCESILTSEDKSSANLIARSFSTYEGRKAKTREEIFAVFDKPIR